MVVDPQDDSSALRRAGFRFSPIGPGNKDVIRSHDGLGVDPDLGVGAETVGSDHAGWDAVSEVAVGFALDADLFKEVRDLLALLLAKA